MIGDRSRQSFGIDSGGRVLRVEAPAVLAVWWPRIAPHLPAVTLRSLGPAPPASSGAAVGFVPDGLGEADTRRLLNAHLHRMHLDQDVLCVHSVALRHGGSRRVVVLLGGHGAGKTLVALGLAERGWRVVSGDVTLVDCHDHGSVPVVVGGTRAVIARRGPVLRWFPDLRLTAADIDTVDLDTVDLSHRPGLLGPDLSAGNVVAVVAVDVDGDPRAGIGKVEVADRHLAASVWLRASGHLLDRVLEGNEMALREFEDVAAARRRVTQVRALADRMPMHAAWGAPRRIAALVEHLSASSAGSGQRRAR